MAVKKSIAIIGEGETEWFYFDSLRIACRYPFKVSARFSPTFRYSSHGKIGRIVCKMRN